MSNTRRSFIQKSTLALGALAIPDIGLSKGFFDEINVAKKILHIGVNPLKSGVNFLKKDFSSSLLLVTDSTYHDLESEGIIPDGILFGKRQLNSSTYLSIKPVSFVNSNFKNKPDFVSDFLISKKMGKKVGILGIGFGEEGQEISRTIHLINEKSTFLKDQLNCDKVFVLMDNPKECNALVSYRDLLESSRDVDYFFASCDDSESNSLWGLKNSKGDPTFLSIQATKNESKSLIVLKDGNLLNYEIDKS